MPSIRTVITLAIPAVTAFFSLLWIFSKKKPPERKKICGDPKDYNQTPAETSMNHAKQGSLSDENNSADAVKFMSKAEEQIIQECKVDEGSTLSWKTTELSKENSSVEADLTSGINGETSGKPQDNEDSQSLEISEQLIEPNSIVPEEAVPVVESVIQSECVKESSIQPRHTELDKQNAENVSSSLDNVEAALISQIICPDTNPELDGKNIQIIDGNDLCVEPITEVSENITQENFNSISISPDQSKHNPTESESAIDPSLSQQSDKISSDSSSETKIQNCVNELEKEKTSEISQLTRSWHEDIEVSENITLNGPSEEVDKSVNNLKFDKKTESVSNYTKEVKEHSNFKEPVSKDRVSSKDRSSQSPSSKSSSPASQSGKSRKGESQSHSETSSNCDNSSEASNDSGKGGSVGEGQQPYVERERVFEFNIPSDICGLFIGSRGKTIRSITDQSGARIHLKDNPYTVNYQICVIEGTETVIDRACSIIKRKFPSITMPGIDMNPVNNTVIMPEIMQLNLPEGISIDVVVSSIVDAGRVFLQQPTHPTFPSLERLNSFMNQCYHHDGAVPDIPKPIEGGVICAAPMLNGWYRAQIMAYYDDTDECDIKYVDYGGYSRITSRCLKQIRSDFMTLPFEAVECYLANITPLDNEAYFSAEAAVILEELTQGKMLQAQVVGKAEDGIPYVHIYQISGPNQTLLVNRELVNRGVVRWIELMS